MASLGNSSNFIGRLTQEPELRKAGEYSVINFTLARNRPKKKDAPADAHPQADFIDCVAWGLTAELIANYVQKGHRLGVNGPLTSSIYTDKNDVKKKKTEILVETIEFIERKSDAERASSDDVSEDTTAPDTSAVAETPAEEDDDENLPF